MGQTADCIVVCPATARIISDLRTGRSADLLSATLVATAAPVVVCPAMHTEMWEHPAVQDNIATLEERGVVIVAPEEGRLAGGDIGKGRLAAPETVVDAVLGVFAQGPLSNRSVLVTAGGTREALDPVRYLGNRSSGKQGHALAEVAASLGASVTLVTTSNLASSPRIQRVDVETAAEMHDAVVAVSDTTDVIVMAAAVADFRPVGVSTHKIKKVDGPPTVGLERTVDILATLGKQKPSGQVLVGFAAETENLRENALGKLESKGADLLVANDVSAPGVGFAHDTNAVTIFGSDGSVRDVALNDKTAIANAVLEAAIERLPTRESNG
jgi:phosphopantothenoylcysteine decarboxylase/phosphopantothenate--cysteine ligase